MNDLQRSLRVLVYATIGLYVVMALLGFFVWDVAHDAKVQASTTNSSLCVLRADLEQRVESARDFIEKHPQGFEGVSVEDIQVSIDNQVRTINALSPLDCDT